MRALEKWFVWQQKAANLIFAGPTTGANALPSFRSLVNADLPFLPRTSVYEYDDFISNQGTSSLGWLFSLNGVGATIAAAHAANVNPTDNAHGVFQLATGTNAAGRAVLSKGLDSINLGTNTTFIQYWRIKIPTLSDATQEYDIAVGFNDGDVTTTADCVDGLYFKYNRNVSPNWIISAANNSTITNTTTSVAVNTNWIWLGIEVNPITSTATFFIDEVQVGTIARANWPVGVGRNTGVLAKIVKSVGTTARLLLLDVFSQRIIRP